MLYKLISKILVKRIKPYMETLVDLAQSWFKPGRQLSDNLLLSILKAMAGSIWHLDA